MTSFHLVIALFAKQPVVIPELLGNALNLDRVLNYQRNQFALAAQVPDVKRGKPFPDIYLHAAQKMGNQDPSKCLVIEDSPMGVRGGVAAGMIVFGYAELMKAENLKEAGVHHIFRDMGNLPGEILAYEQTALQPAQARDA